MSPETLRERVDAWLRQRGADGWVEQGGVARLELCEQWREVSTKYGPDSNPARGCLLALVREAWGEPELHLQYSKSAHTWSVVVPSLDAPGFRAYRASLTEAEALVSALEVVARNGKPVHLPLFGQAGVRDPDSPCADFEPGEPDGMCSTDGHHMCRECEHAELCEGCGQPDARCECPPDDESDGSPKTDEEWREYAVDLAPEYASEAAPRRKEGP
jgi:hypothetical protein